MIVKIHLYTQAQPIRYEGVINTYQKGDLYVVMISPETVYKFPLQHIFRITETQ